jgi:hypothetical protein
MKQIIEMVYEVITQSTEGTYLFSLLEWMASFWVCCSSNIEAILWISDEQALDYWVRNTEVHQEGMSN